MRWWWREITGLVLPVACGGCARARTPLCEACRRVLCRPGGRRVRPDPEPAGLPVVCAAAPYADAVRAVLLGHKERGALGLARPLGIALAGAVRASVALCGAPGGGELLLVPVPSSRRAVRARGHDAVRRIALAAAGELRRSGSTARVLPVLRQRRAVADQSGLGARERLANLAGALEVVPGAGRLIADGAGSGSGGRGRAPGSARVVLVDDLMTTGASLAEAARALRAGSGPRSGGPVRVSAAVVAAPSISFELNRN
ncbi:ComF family protein [Streptomyces sp. NPDC016309]|uniref:ComF family protein n=1 Tax=Streptomyces sp. NPDC016309 TaxID=3364965 RepID=UPI0037018239